MIQQRRMQQDKKMKDTNPGQTLGRCFNKVGRCHISLGDTPSLETSKSGLAILAEFWSPVLDQRRGSPLICIRERSH